MVWESPASGAVTSDSSLSGTGLTGSPLSVDVSGTQFPVIPISKGGTASTSAADARSSLGLGTAAEANTGTGTGNVPVLDTSGHIADAIIPDGITRDTEVQGIFDTSLDFATTGNTEVGINIDYDTSTRKLNATVTGALIHSDASLSGDGTTANPLTIANNAITEPRMEIGNTPTDEQVLSWDTSNSRFLWKDDATAMAGSGIDRVTSDATLSGEGIVGDVLSVAAGAIDEARLNVSNSPTDGYVLGYNGSGNLEWVAQTGGMGGGAVDSVTGGIGLTQTTTTGDVTINIDVTEADFPTIPVVKGGTGATNASDARTALGVTVYGDSDVDARILDRLQNAPGSGASFSDRFLMWDDSNPGELRSANTGAIRNYTTASWAHPTSAALLPIAKLASGGAVNQVLGWTATGQEWVSVSGMGVDTNNYTDAATLDITGDQLTLTIGLTGSLSDVVSNSVTLPSGGGGTGDITAVTTSSTSGLTGGVDSGAADLSIDIIGLNNLGSTSINDLDRFLIHDFSNPSDPLREMSIGSLVLWQAGISTTLDSRKRQVPSCRQRYHGRRSLTMARSQKRRWPLGELPPPDSSSPGMAPAWSGPRLVASQITMLKTPPLPCLEAI